MVNASDNKNNYFMGSKSMKIISLFFFMLAGMLVANDVDEGLQAYGENNFQKASMIWERSCKQGDTSSCNYLGDLYRSGKGVEYQSYLMAIELYNKSCNRDNPKGCFMLAQMHKDGLGVKQDILKSVEKFSKSCELGYSASCRKLGEIYQNGYSGLEKNYNNAISYYEKSCQDGELDSCNNLAFMYYNGEGVQVDKKKAKYFYGKACGNGANQYACNTYKALDSLDY